MTGNVEVFQHGTSQRHTAHCDCGWQTSVGTLKAAQILAQEHRQAGCPGPAPPTTDVVPSSPTRVEPAGAWTGEQVEVIRRSIAPEATDDELALFAKVCQHKRLDPFAGEIIAVHRKAKQPDGSWSKRMVIQETVAGLRALAERSGLYNGQDPPEWCGQDGRWVEVWLDSKPPAAARVAVYRKGWDRPTVGVARYSSYVQLDRDGHPRDLWKTGPDFMLWKCAEAAALKRAFKHAIADAGVSARVVEGPSKISMEAREAGLDDDGRHALVAEVTGGRTDSTRDLSDDEALEVRAELARIRAEHGADPETGEIVEPPPGDAPPEEPDAVARTIARAAGDLEQRLEQLTGDQVRQLKEWRRAVGLARPVGTLSAADRARIALELDHRDQTGWQPKDQTTDDDVVEADLFGDEPF